jgi:hypothetical protein
MDVEKTIEFLLEQAAAHDARMAAHRAEFLADSLEFRERLRASEEKFNRQDERLGRRLERAARLSIEEHRRERVRRKALDAAWNVKFAELTEAQAKTQKSLEQFIESMKQPRNGHDKA